MPKFLGWRSVFLPPAVITVITALLLILFLQPSPPSRVGTRFIPNEGTTSRRPRPIHCKKKLAIFPSPAGMSRTKLFLAENNLITPVQGEFGLWHHSWGGKIANLFFYTVASTWKLNSWRRSGHSLPYSSQHIPWKQFSIYVFPKLFAKPHSQISSK